MIDPVELRTLVSSWPHERDRLWVNVAYPSGEEWKVAVDEGCHAGCKRCAMERIMAAGNLRDVLEAPFR